MTVQDIANLAVTGQALALASSNFPKKNKQVTTKSMLNMSLRNIVGANLIGLTAQNVGTL